MSTPTVLEQKQQAALEKLAAGEVDEAAAILRECLEITESSSGADSLETAQAAFTLALCLFRKQPFTPERFQEIEVLSNRTLAIRTAIKGRIDSSVAITADFLGSIYRFSGQCSEAENMFRVSLDNAMTLVGPSHINTAKAELSLAVSLVEQEKNFEEAKSLLEKCLVTRRRFFGFNGVETVSALKTYANVLERMGLHDQAREALSESQNLEVLSAPLAPNQQAMR